MQTIFIGGAWPYANGPEKRDTDFSLREFVERNNSELLGAYGNFINRTLAFIRKYQNGIVPKGTLEPALAAKIEGAFHSIGNHIEAAALKDALGEALELARFSNRYFDEQQPWKTRRDDPAACANALYNCAQLAANLGVLLAPFSALFEPKTRLLAWPYPKLVAAAHRGRGAGARDLAALRAAGPGGRCG